MKELAQTEQEMRETKDPWPQTREDLIEYMDSLTEREHDYGTSAYAMSLAAVAAFNYVSHKLGATGFQAGCAQMNFLRRECHMKYGFQILDYRHLLYPQYLNSGHFPSHEQLLMENRVELARAARELLASEEHEIASPEVRAHWEYVASLSPEQK